MGPVVEGYRATAGLARRLGSRQWPCVVSGGVVVDLGVVVDVDLDGDGDLDLDGAALTLGTLRLRDCHVAAPHELDAGSVSAPRPLAVRESLHYSCDSRPSPTTPLSPTASSRLLSSRCRSASTA